MISVEEIYQAGTLAAVVGMADMLERRKPRFPVDRLHNLRLNVLAVIVVIIAGEVSKALLVRGFNAINLSHSFAFDAIGNLPGFAKILLGLIIADFCLYWVHRGMHRLHTLWLTHAFHHSIDQLWWLSGSRTSVTHLILFAAPQVFLGYYVLMLSPSEAAVAFSIGVVVNIWIHTNISVNLGPLEWLLITPDYHRVHHGARGLASRNIGFVLTIWDRMFGTYADPRTVGEGFSLSFIPTRSLLRLIVGV